jgi:hypothetical protein
MITKNATGAALTAYVALTLAITDSAKAQSDPTVSMQLDNYSQYSDVINLSTMQIPGNPQESGYIGIYSFDVESSGTTANVPIGANSIWTTCLSPAGTINAGSGYATYNYETYAQANNGINPPAWAWNNNLNDPQYWGIQNANYLWQQVIGNNSQPTELSADQATALVLAMYAALYNSTGYGVVDNNPSDDPKFNPNFGSGNVDGTVAADYSTYVGLLNPTDVGDNLANGYVLVPTSDAQNAGFGQEFIFMASENPNVSVPESAGMGICAGLGCLIFSFRYCFRRASV